MKILILGVTGMLGHQLANKLKGKFAVYGTIRGDQIPFNEGGLFEGITIVPHISAYDFTSVQVMLKKVNPDIVINCIGIIKQLEAAKDPVETITINALVPHQLAKFCINNNIRLFQMSTDCVFSGNKGNYTEEDISDAVDLYGKTKALGEVTGKGITTLRTSIIGHELREKKSLIEWILSQKGRTIEGYKRALYTGVTTNTLAYIIEKLIVEFPDFSGLWHVSSEAISKYDLVKLVNQIYHLQIDVKPNELFICDRRLNGQAFLDFTNIKIPDWKSMIEAMYLDAKNTYVN